MNRLMESYKILAAIAGFDPRLVLPPTSPDHPYRVVIPGLNRDVPYYWSDHARRLDARYPHGEPI